MTAVLSPTDLMRALSDEQKEELFVVMMRQFALNVADENVVQLWDGNVLLGHYVRPGTPEAARLFPDCGPSPEYLEMLAKLPPEVAAALMRPIPEDLDLDDVLTRDEIRKIRREVLSRTPELSPTGSGSRPTNAGRGSGT